MASTRAISTVLDTWAAAVVSGRPSAEDWPSLFPMGRIIEEGLTGAAIRPPYGSRPLRPTLPPSYYVVERILAGLKPRSRLVIGAEHGLLNGRVPPRSTQAQRAAIIGLSKRQYRSRLVEVRGRVRAELDRKWQT